MTDYSKETDALGEFDAPADALYGFDRLTAPDRVNRPGSDDRRIR